MYVEVSLPISLFKTFTYIVPKKYKKLVFVNQSVTVPFNKKKVDGFITKISLKSNYKGELLPLFSINKNSFIISPDLSKTLYWISKYYICPIGTVLHNTINYQHKKNFSFPKVTYLEITEIGKREFSNIKFKSQSAILAYILKEKRKVDIKELRFCAKSYIQSCKRLIEKGLLKSSKKPNLKGLLDSQNLVAYNNLKLSSEQNKIYKSILKDIQGNCKKIFLGGVPASGKTEIYSKIIRDYIKKNKRVIILVPEIALIKQLYIKLQSYYNGVGVWHSKLKQSEKDNILYNIKNDGIKILVSTRSGLFLPLNNLGLIIIDEEHDTSYKQDLNAPYYHARDVGLMRAKFSKSNILLVSSNPSIETYYNIKNKKYISYFLKNRYEKFASPEVRLVNMAHEKGMISKILIDKIKDRISKNEKILILQNKKGIDKGGIQKVEIVLKKIFPDIKILRYDQESISRSDSYYKILDSFNNGDKNILLGTQMISKGLNFKNITLVAIITADIGLNLPDFRSGEKIFHLIYQYIGRAGRGSKNSEAVIQCFNTDDIHIKNACQNKMSESYNIIINERKELNYPPYSRLIRILFMGKNEKNILKKANQFLYILNKNKNISLLGPSLAPIEKERSLWRYQILIKCEKKYWQNFHDWMNNNMLITKLYTNYKNTKFIIDVDPISML